MNFNTGKGLFITIIVGCTLGLLAGVIAAASGKILPVLVIGSIVLGLVSLYKIFIMDKAKYIEDSKAFADRIKIQDMTVSLEPPSPKKETKQDIGKTLSSIFFPTAMKVEDKQEDSNKKDDIEKRSSKK
ncbi:MAG: hypothetical protein VX335_03910 [Pseudomonadota bacterium]|nr:hypothetical protein [Pseudomonadota bacterium]